MEHVELIKQQQLTSYCALKFRFSGKQIILYSPHNRDGGSGSGGGSGAKGGSGSGGGSGATRMSTYACAHASSVTEPKSHI